MGAEFGHRTQVFYCFVFMTRMKQKESYTTSCKLGLRIEGCDSLLIKFRSTCASNLESPPFDI